jgi:hypothetical protein
VPSRAKRTTTTVIEGDDDATAQLAIEPADDDPLSTLLEQFGGESGYRVRLERFDDRNQPRYVDTVPLTLDLVEEAQRLFGGGRYRGRIIDGHHKYQGGVISFFIEGPPASRLAATTTPAAAVPLEAPRRSARDDAEAFGMAAVMESINNSNRATLAFIEKLSQPRQSFDVVALLGALSPIVLELIKGGRGKALTAEDMRGIIESRSPGHDPMQVLTVVREFMELQSTIQAAGGGGGGETTAQAALRMFGPLFAKLVDPAAPARALAPVAVVDPSAPAPSPMGPTATDPAWAVELQPAIGQLERRARDGADARDFARSIIVHFMPDHHKGILRELVALPDAQELVAARFPQLGAYPEWLGDFIDEARDVFGLLEDDAPPPPPVVAKPTTKVARGKKR